MAAPVQWEVVKAKKQKGSTHPLTKAQKKKFVQNMPRVEALPSVQKSSTIYDGFQKTADPHDSRVEQSKTSVDAELRKNSVPGKKKKTEQDKVKKDKTDQEKGKKDKPLSLELALKQVDRDHLEAILSQSQTMFPDNPEVWLKDLVSYLNLCLEKVPEPNLVYNGQPRDYPLCKLDSKSRSILATTLKKCSTPTLEHLLSHCLQHLLTNSAQGLGTYGYRILLQLLVFQDPTIISAKLPQYLEQLKSNQSRPLRCLVILWVVGQCGVKSLSCGLRVWLDVMLLALNIRALAPFSVDYLENLFKWHRDRTSAFGVISIREYFNVLDIIFSPDLSISDDLKQRLQAQYLILKTLVYGDSPHADLHRLFPSYLSRATPSAAGPLKAELLSCLVHCLATDKRTFGIWRQLYRGHLPQTGELLTFLLEHWSATSRHLDSRQLKETLQSFCASNEQLQSQGKPPEGLSRCSEQSKMLLSRASRRGFPRLAVVTIIFLVSLVIFDILTSGSAMASYSALALDRVGLLSLVTYFCHHVSTGASTAVSFLRESLTTCWGFITSILVPKSSAVGLQIWTWVLATSQAIWPVFQPVLANVAEAIAHGARWAYMVNPEFWDLVWSYVGYIATAIWQQALVLSSSLLVWLKTAYLWIAHVDLSGMNIRESALTGLQCLQNVTVRILHWCSHFVMPTSH